MHALIVLYSDEDLEHRANSVGHIWGIGITPEDAIADGSEWVKSELDEDVSEVASFEKATPEGFICLPCTQELAARVKDEGGFVPFDIIGGVATKRV